ncbi:DUF6187 family protein [Streptomyces goshikiensis]|uniref:DUF6187 family protein n=1 Tax=Streptomyces goshikiensis TaxID=1942 RepID=UPI00167ACE5D|nr:DUF6187 family protein [Streptomyces goshikiensis]GHD81402.1 hypothetical protein GCM10010336_66570 [Streptomyces goshikiensis]
MIVTQYTPEEAALEPQSIVLGQPTERILAALGIALHTHRVPHLMIAVERAAHTDGWSISWDEAVEAGLDLWEEMQPRFVGAGLTGIRRNGAPRENLIRFGTAVATEIGMPRDAALTVLLTVCLIRREEFDARVHERRASL